MAQRRNGGDGLSAALNRVSIRLTEVLSSLEADTCIKN